MKLEGKRGSRSKAMSVAFVLAFASLAASTAGCATKTQQTNLTSADKALESTSSTRPAPRVGKSQRTETFDPTAARDLRQGLVSETNANAADDDLEPKRTTTNDVPSSQHRRSGTFGAWK